MKHIPAILPLLFFVITISGYQDWVKNSQSHMITQPLYFDAPKNTTAFFPSCDKYKHRNTPHDFAHYGYDVQTEKRPNNWLCICPEQLDKYKKLEFCYKEVAPHLSYVIRKRLKAQAEIENGKEYISTQSYHLGKDATQLLKNYDYSDQEFAKCSGNQLQQEYIDGICEILHG
jgi:hypothetical protein